MLNEGGKLCLYDGNLVMFSEAGIDVTVLVDIVELLTKAKVAGGTATLPAELTTVFVVLVECSTS